MSEGSASAPLRRVLVTGISGNLGRRLAPLLASYDLLSVDLHRPPPDVPVREFFSLDLSTPSGQQDLARLVQTELPEVVLHLAFVIDPVRTGILDERRMRQANVVATQHLLEAIAAANRERLKVPLFVFPSSVTAYGHELPQAVREDAPLRAEGFPYAVHKREADEMCQRMHPALGGCAVYILRPHIFAGRTVDNFILRAIRGKPSGRGWLAREFEKTGWRLPILLPWSARGENLFQFVHVDDVARILHWTLTNYGPGELHILNVAGSGPPIAFGECAKLAKTSVLRLPSTRMVTWLLRLFWSLGLSGIPPQALAYFLGSYTMDTTRLRETLGREYANIVRFSSRDALLDALQP